MRVVGVCVCALLAACNAAFGLDQTISVDAAISDFDRDGVADMMDNCPTVANSDQANADADSFGNACDSCPNVSAASVHDDDEDGVGDACDACPGVPDFGDDGDTDGVGDICDHNRTGPNKRLVFESFEMIRPEWQATGLSWIATADAAAPSAILPPNDGGLAFTGYVASAPWRTNIGIRSRKPWMGDEQVGVEMHVNNHVVRCRSRCDATGDNCVTEIIVDGVLEAGVGPLEPRPSANLMVYVTANNSIGCGSTQSSVSTMLAFSITGPATFAVLASPNLQVTYFEQIE
jgi:hypothetical protein